MTVDGLSSPPGPRGLVNELACIELAFLALSGSPELFDSASVRA